MKCCDCGSGVTFEFFAEKIPCTHCGETNVITYNVCETCGLVWKAIGDEVIDKMTDSSITEETPVFEAAFMQDMLHKCLKCNAIAYEIGPNCYRCSACAFEWEIF